MRTFLSHPRPACLSALAGAGVLIAATLVPAHAHPHVWVSVEATVVVEQGAVVGFRHRWAFDELYSAMAIEGLDTNKDGVYSRDELAELAQVNIDGLKDFGFFTFPKLGDTAVAFSAPKDYWLTYAPVPAKVAAAPPPAAAPAPEQPGLLSRLKTAVVGASKPDAAAAAAPANVLTLEFTLPLQQPVLVEAPGFTFSITDPSWFIAFDLASPDAIKLGPGAPAECRLTTADAATTGTDAPRAIEEAFSTQFGGAAAVTLSGMKLIKLACGSKS
jgi:ABC-type uncharacterized transport system substrate-binding protein